MKVLLGIDAGTTSVSSALYEIESKSIIAATALPHNAYQKTVELHRKQDLDAIFVSIEESVNQTLASASAAVAGEDISVEGIGVTGQMHGYALLDETCKPCGLFTTWEDRRASEICPDGETWLEKFRRNFGDLVSPDSGITAATGFASVNLYIAHQLGQIPPSARWVVSVQDWLVSRLTGEPPVTEASCAHSTGLYDPRAQTWQDELVRGVGAKGLMPPLATAGTRAGETNTRFVTIPRGTPVFVGMGDNQASFLASVSRPEEEILVTVGTGSQVSALIDGYRLVSGLDTRPFADNRHLLVGAPLCGGRAYALMAEFIREIGTSVFDCKVDSDLLYERMNALADLETKVQCDTTFIGTRTDPDARGGFYSIDSDHFNVRSFIGSVIRGIARELYRMYSCMPTTGSSVVSTGNGVRKNPLLLRALSEEFGLPAILCPFEEEAATGAALIAGIGTGVFDDFNDAFEGLKF